MNKELLQDNEPIHGYFELTYAQYIAIPRSVLQSMPVEWQRRFVECMQELDDTIDWRQNYLVYLRDNKGRFMNDPLADYNRGRRRIPHKGEFTGVPFLRDI